MCMTMLISSACIAETPPPAYQRAANAAGIPVELLWAVAKVESNTRLTIGVYPWPWTLNVAGQGKRYRTREEACEGAIQAIELHGAKSVDIGLTQQNWGWVGKDFYKHPCDALDPIDNLRTASIRLKECYADRQNWIDSAGCYHRPAGGAPAAKYKAEVLRRLKANLASR